MDQIVRALCGCHIATRFGVCGIHQKMFGPGATIQKAGYAISQQTFHRPGFAFIIRYGSIQAIPPVIISFPIWKNHAPLGFGRTQRMISKRNKQQRTFIQTHKDQTLATINRRELGSIIRPSLSHIFRDAHRHPQFSFLIQDTVAPS